MRAEDLIAALEKKLGTSSQAQLANALGVTVQMLHNWKKRNEDLSPLQVATALAKARTAAVKTSQLQTIQPLVEFFPIDGCLSKHEKSWQLFSGGNDATLYAKELKKALESASGIYIFYDSRGQALYVGKARQQSLWKEMNLAFNRPREIQTIALVAHPDRNLHFKPGYEKLRQPKQTQLELYDLAHYFSAYQVENGMIDDVEALLVRGFANDLLNVKMETFANTKS